MQTVDRLLRRITSDDGLLFIIGTHAWLAGLFLGWEIYVTGEGRYLCPQAWPVIFIVAGVTSALYHHNRSSRTLWQWSGGLLLAAYLSRGAVIFVAMVEDPELRRVAILLPASLWLVVAAFVAALWHRALIPRRDG